MLENPRLTEDVELKRELAKLELPSPAALVWALLKDEFPKAELRDAEELNREIATPEFARFVEAIDEFDLAAEPAKPERPAPIFDAPLFIAMVVPELLVEVPAEFPKDRKPPGFPELRATELPAPAVPPPELPKECHPGEVFARAAAFPALPLPEFPNECQPGEVLARGAEEPERAADCGPAALPAPMLPERPVEYPGDLP